MFQDYPKWVYLTDGPQESYAEGMAPVLCDNEEQEALLKERSPEKTNEVVEQPLMPDVVAADDAPVVVPDDAVATTSVQKPADAPAKRPGRPPKAK